MKIKFLLLLTLLVILSATTIADPEQYTYPGVTRASLFSQEGIGQWAGNVGVISPMSGTFTNLYPLVFDLDNDLSNEIIVVDGSHTKDTINTIINKK